MVMIVKVVYMVDVDWSVCVHVHTLKPEEGEGDGCIGSQEVEVWFSTYQRLFLTPHPHPRPPTV